MNESRQQNERPVKWRKAFLIGLCAVTSFAGISLNEWLLLIFSLQKLQIIVGRKQITGSEFFEFSCCSEVSCLLTS